MGIDGREVLGDGPLTIPAHPLAVRDDGDPDWFSQRVLTRYYLEAGATGLAVGVHTTQFEIHLDRALYRRTLAVSGEVAQQYSPATALVAGVCGDTEQAVAEAEAAASLGYRAVLLCPYGMSSPDPDQSLERARHVCEVLPTLGFYMQTSVGGSYLPQSYWSQLFALDGVAGVKIAPFDRYWTREVLAAVAGSGRSEELVVLTGNDDTIVSDLVTPQVFDYAGERRTVRFAGGLLGQWAVGTKAAVDLTRKAFEARGGSVPESVLADGAALVSINDALFDPQNGFAGAVAGVNEMLRQQGLIGSRRCLTEPERLSAGQQERISAVRAAHPALLDEDFIAESLSRWQADAR